MTKKFTAYAVYLRISFFTALFSSLVFTVTTVYQVQVIHLNPLQLVLAGTVFEVTVFLFEIPTGIVADIYSRKLSVIVGMMLTGLGFVIQGSFPRYVAILVSQVFWGIGSTFTSGAIEAWIADEEPLRDIHSVYMKGAQFGYAGSVLGILLSTILANYSVSLPIRLGGGMLAVFSLFLLVFMPEYCFSSTAPEEMNTFRKMGFTFVSGINIIKADRLLTMVTMVALFTGLASEGYDRLSTAHFLEDTVFPQIFGLTPVTWFGILGILGTVINITVMQAVMNSRRSRGDQGGTSVLLMTNLSYTLVMVVFGITRNFATMVAAYLFLNMLRAVNRPIMSSLVNSHIKGSARATILSTNEQVNSLGELLGGPIIGVVASRLSIAVGITSTALFLFPVILVFARMKIHVNENHIRRLS